MKRIITFLTLVLAVWSSVFALTPVLAKPVASVDRMYQYVMSKNPGSSFSYEIAKAYYDTGNRWGIRGDIALCQAAIETGWFRYEGGTAVTPSDHNYCGLGVTTLGQKGCQFSSVQQGVDAHLQHLWSYATTASLPSGWTKVDPRFGYNSKRSAYFEYFGNGVWAMASGYGSKIMQLYNEMAAYVVEPPSISATPSSVTFDVVKGSENPSQTIAVKGKWLTSGIRIASNSGKYTLSTKEMDAKGGNLTITLNASFGIGSWDDYVAIESGYGTDKVRIKVPVKTTISEGVHVPVPELTLSATSSDLTAVEGEASPSTSLTVTGKDLEGEITYSSSDSRVSVTPASGWSATEGGVLTVSAATSAVGSYNAVITVKAGALSRQFNVSVNITAKPVVRGSLALSGTTVWMSAGLGSSYDQGFQKTGKVVRNVTVTGTNINGQISLSSADSQISFEPASLPAAGGEFAIIFTPTKVTSGYVTIPVTVSASNADAVTVNCKTKWTGENPVIEPEPAPKNPELTVSTASVSLSATKGDAAPSASVTVTAADLEQDITVTSSNSKVTVAKASGWNATTGGTLVISADAASAGSYNATVTVASGSLSKQIAVAVTIAKKPVLNVSAANVSLRATEGEAAPSASVTVSADDLDQDITVTSSTGSVTVSKSGWNATTGGTLVIAATTGTPGSYNATVTVASGSLSKQIAVAVTIEKKPEVIVRGSLSASTGTFWMTADADAGFKANGKVVRELTVTGTNINGNIKAVSSDSQITVSPATLPAEGGTFTLIYTPAKASSGYVTIPVTISADNADAVTVNCKTKWSGQYPAGSLSVSATTFWMTADADAGFKSNGYVTREFNVTGSGIIGEISISSGNGQVSVSPATLPAEGGKVTLTYNPTSASSSYVTIPVYVSARNASTVTVNCKTKWSGRRYANGMTGIDDVEADIADNAEYYTLQGVRVEAENLTPGLYIRREGNTVTKVLIK